MKNKKIVKIQIALGKPKAICFGVYYIGGREACNSSLFEELVSCF
jgi:hypothetical protein